MSYGAKQYKQTSVTTATRGQVLIMLYEAAIRHVRKASEYIDQNDLKNKGIHIGKAHDIINELATTLDFNVGGDIAKELERLYNFIVEKLIEANKDNNKKVLESVDKILSNLLDGWKGAVGEFERGKK